MRREFSKAVKRLAAFRSKGHCEQCKIKLRVGEFHYDHIIPDWMGGEPTIENCEVLCIKCHRRKTREKDVPAIAKSKRIIDKNRGIKTSPRKLPCGRNSPFKKKITGEVVAR
jgi:5-methylcytosine-specific restriction endonuclease McrA